MDQGQGQNLTNRNCSLKLFWSSNTFKNRLKYRLEMMGFHSGGVCGENSVVVVCSVWRRCENSLVVCSVLCWWSWCEMGLVVFQRGGIWQVVIVETTINVVDYGQLSDYDDGDDEDNDDDDNIYDDTANNNEEDGCGIWVG